MGAALGFLKGIAVFGALWNLFGPWGTAIVIALVLGGFWLLVANASTIFGWMLTREAKKMGAVLASADVSVHSVSPAPVPDDAVFGDDEEDREFNRQLEESGAPEGDYEWYFIDLTIRPKVGPEGEAEVQWEPDSLQFAKPEAANRALEFDMDCLMAQVERWENGRWVKKDVETAFGEKRLRLWAGFTPGMRTTSLTYLGNPLVEVQLPTVRSLATARG